MAATTYDTTDTDARATDRTTETSMETLSKDRIFRLLSVRRRRDVLTYLDEVERETTLSDLAEHIAANENGIDVAHLSAAQRKRVYVSLYQCHLPKMDDANVIAFDRTRGTIERRAPAEQMVPYLQLDPATTTKPTSWGDAVGARLRHALASLLRGQALR